MKKLIIYIIFVFVVGFSSYFSYGYYLSSKYADTAIPYMEEVLPQISTWDADIVRQYMAPEVLQTVTAENLKNLMAALSKIGELKSISKFSFQNEVSGDNVQFVGGTVITYEVEAEYSSGATVVTIRLLLRDDSYQVYHFNFQSQALAAS
ncbi:MAG: hypothetical protein KAU22_12095 [Desulfuromonadales bacterium]|nr:hypothetical protein [Desulfuromonadales bacterium]